MAGERLAWIVPFLDGVACAVFDPDSLRCEITAMVRPGVWADGDGRAVYVDPQGYVGYTLRVALPLIQGACQRDAHVETLNSPPAFETAVCL